MKTSPAVGPGNGWRWKTEYCTRCLRGAESGRDVSRGIARLFGRAFLAIDPKSKKVLWHHREEETVDHRGVAMKNGRIYFYHPNQFLACLDTTSGKVVWRNTRAEKLQTVRHFLNVHQPHAEVHGAFALSGRFRGSI